MTKAKSCGIIPIYQHKNDLNFLLIKSHNGNWSFPKGKKEHGESDIETAVRELKEETGIRSVALLDFPPKSESYVFRQSGELIHKNVTYFLGQVNNPHIQIQESEVSEAGWFTPKQALDIASFPKIKEMIADTLIYLYKS